MVKRKLSVVFFIFLFVLSACSDGESSTDSGKKDVVNGDNSTTEVEDLYLEEMVLSSYQESILSDIDGPIVIGYMDENKVLIQDQGLWTLFDGEETYQTTEVRQAQGYFVSFNPETNTVIYANPITDRVREFDLDSDMTYGELSDTFMNISYSKNFVSPSMILANRTLYGIDTNDLFPLETGNIIYVNPTWTNMIWAKDSGNGQCNINLYEDIDDTRPLVLDVSSTLNCGEFLYMENDWRVYSLYDNHESSYEGYFAISKEGEVHTYFPDEHVPSGVQKDFNSEEILYNGRLYGISFTYKESNKVYYVVTSPDLSVVHVFDQQELNEVVYFDKNIIAKKTEDTVNIYDHQDNLLYAYNSPFEQLTNMYIIADEEYIIMNETNTSGHNMDIVDTDTYHQVFTGAYFGYRLFDDQLYIQTESNEEYILNQDTWTQQPLAFNDSQARRYFTSTYFYQIVNHEISIYEQDGTWIETYDILGYISREESHTVLVKVENKYFIIGQ